MHTTQHGVQQANQARQLAQQLIQQTQQGSQQYRMMMLQEQQNIQMLEQILQREKQAAQLIEQSLQSHDLAIQRCQEVVHICNQMQGQLTGQEMAGGSLSAMQQPFNSQSQFQTGSQFNYAGTFRQK
ncbi:MULTISPECIES: hypothetical protein [Cytobacillus]|uniref:AMP-dependent synthetase and ligase n=1 Tax=Cytobacillus oceanisediminis 2691 TaxID=1196031 RepID=A0A160MAV8_9BACI|nr:MULTISPECIES: hypothetical protein [Cytobacillus]AND39936.1 hypothetical protein A361_12545 [Cytobacillus oceanisediminis 2691]MCM3395130.1 hypothetical protein [Cytobacillus oceanisediminis]UQX55739.1 hypothetical protein M5V91_08850 [Cytobacillus pseudoceanisediminis]